MRQNQINLLSAKSNDKFRIQITRPNGRLSRLACCWHTPSQFARTHSQRPSIRPFTSAILGRLAIFSADSLHCLNSFLFSLGFLRETSLSEAFFAGESPFDQNLRVKTNCSGSTSQAVVWEVGYEVRNTNGDRLIKRLSITTCDSQVYFLPVYCLRSFLCLRDSVTTGQAGRVHFSFSFQLLEILT